MSSDRTQRFAEFVFRYRFYLAAFVLLCIATVLAAGIGRVIGVTQGVEALQETPSEGTPVPRIFDARYDIWFVEHDSGLKTYHAVEEQFIAEDVVLLAFSENEHPWGIFSPKGLATIARLTDAIEKVKYVRQVRSLTRSPWVRWGQADADEEGLLVSDLFEKDPSTYSEDEVIERMVAVLGAKRAADLVGEDRVRQAIGPDARLEDHIGEPRLVGRIISEDGRSAAFQILLLRDKVGREALVKAFGDNEAGLAIGPSMHANESQWLAMEGIEKLTKNDPGGYTFHLAGMPDLERSFLAVGLSDLKWVLVMFAVLALILFITFRTVAAVLVPLLVVILVVMAMQGTILWMGDLLNNVTAIAPNMITAIGIADAVHLVAAYYVLRPNHSNRKDLIVDVIRFNAIPVFLTSVTTAVGFFSLMSSDILPMKMLGYTTGIGTVSAFFISMTIVPACLSLLPLKAPSVDVPREAAGGAHWSDTFVPRVVKHNKVILVGSLVVIGLSAIGLSKIEISSDLPRMFPSDYRLRVDVDWVEDHLSGTGDLEIVLSAPPFVDDAKTSGERQTRIDELAVAAFLAKEEGQVLAPELADEFSSLRKLEAAHQRHRIGVDHAFLVEVERFEKRVIELSKEPHSSLNIISNIESPLDVLRKMNQVQHQNDVAYYRVPGPQDVPVAARTPTVMVDPWTQEAQVIPAQSASSMASQYYLQYENGAKPEENLSRVLSADRRSFRLSAAIEQAPSRQQQEAFLAIEKLIRDEFPLLAGASTAGLADGEMEPLAATTMTGKTYLFANMLQRFALTMLTSIGIALVLITLLIAAVYRSFKLAMVSLVPNVLPLVLPIGVMGLIGIRIDGPAVLVIAVALGICVDDTIHFFSKFNDAQKSGKDVNDSLSHVFRKAGRALSATTVILIFGFSVLMMSDFRGNAMIGYLAVIMVALAWVADFIVTPALLSLVGQKRTTGGEGVR